MLFTHLKIIGNLLVTFFVKDQKINLTDHEKLNEFPSTILILNPGGCALYEFPIKMDQIHMFIKAAKKPKLVSKTRSKIIIWISTFESLYLRIVSSTWIIILKKFVFLVINIIEIVKWANWTKIQHSNQTQTSVFHKYIHVFIKKNTFFCFLNSILIMRPRSKVHPAM